MSDTNLCRTQIGIRHRLESNAKQMTTVEKEEKWKEKRKGSEDGQDSFRNALTWTKKA